MKFCCHKIWRKKGYCHIWRRNNKVLPGRRSDYTFYFGITKANIDFTIDKTCYELALQAPV